MWCASPRKGLSIRTPAHSVAPLLCSSLLRGLFSLLRVQSCADVRIGRQKPRENVDELRSLIAKWRAIGCLGRVNDNWINIERIEQMRDLPLGDRTAVFVLGPDRGRIFVQLGNDA